MKPTAGRARSALLGSVAVVVLSAAAVLGSTHVRAGALTKCASTSSGLHRYAPGSGKTVALTFDDGPGPSTAAMMQILTSAHVEATFFNIGTNEVARPGRVRAEQSAGFALGSHTWDHSDLTTLDRAGQAREIDRERDEQASLVGAYPCLLRPPYGNYNATTLSIAQRRGMSVWNWSVDTEDWKADGSDDKWWVNRIVTRGEAGASLRNPVILMHNAAGGDPATVDALPAIINYYKTRGYRFVDLYAHTGHPTVARISPASGPTAGRTRITVTGHGFFGVRAVSFGGVDGTAVKVGSSTSLTVSTPAHSSADVYVRVVTTFGTSPGVLAGRFQFVAK